MSNKQEDTKVDNTNHKSITYNDVATKLLNDKFLLTALELHTELVESGRELRQLKDFFSNPGNFEITHETRISRSESQATLDSLDLTRFSEDGAGTDERVAVLEFELRKAKETINALRNNLTVATESETSTPDKGSLRNITSGNIKPHEQRALNFLINEYLLMHEYKLTSITFADENQNQDFDDWDDVGLNISKPPELLTLYREGLKQSGQNCFSISTQTDEYEDEESVKKNQYSLELINELKEQISQLERENAELKESNSNMLTENELLSSQLPITIEEELMRHNAGARDNMNIENSNINNMNNNNNHNKNINNSTNNDNDNNSGNSNNLNMNINNNKNTPNSKDSLGSESPERFEIIDRNMPIFKKEDSISMIDDNISNSSFNTNDWTNLTLNPNDGNEKTLQEFHVSRTSSKERDLNFTLFDPNFSKEPFRKEVFSLCYVSIPQKVDNDILDNILNNSITNENLVHTLSQSLLRIIPNIILNKREEAMPLLISAIHLNQNSNERDKLLQLLFNLKKKPSDSERIMILTSIVGIARFSKESLVENEILPHCWEQLTHKYVERRLLVAEACTALIPYVSSQIRNSLILSMLQQMLDDKDESVRETVIRALALVITLCDDNDKYSQCEELVLNTLNDTSHQVVNLSIQILFPVLAKWALDIDLLTSSLMKTLLQKCNYYLKDNEILKYSDKIVKIISVIEGLLPFLFVHVADNEKFIENIEKDMAMEIRSDFVKCCTNLTDPVKFQQSDINFGMILYEFDKYIGDNPKSSSDKMDWILDMMIPDLINNLNHIETSTHYRLLQSFISLFTQICIIFGNNFTRFKIRPIFQTQIQTIEQILVNINQFSPSLNIIPIYLISILSYLSNKENNDDVKEELSNIFKKFLCALPLCGTPLDCLEITVKYICELQLQELVVSCLWDAVVHQRPLIRAASANLFALSIKYCDKNLLNLRITPALVTLASDSDVLVKTAAIPALGALITDCNIKEIHDKVYMQIQSYISDPSLRDNHTLLRQLIVTMGNIINSCTESFRNEVILPQLTSLSSYMLQMSNQTRKVDMALALVEAYSILFFSPNNNKQGIRNNVNIILQGLRSLELVISENHSLQSHRDVILSMIRECDMSKSDTNVSSTGAQFSMDRNTKLTISQNVNQGVEEMRQRVSKIFNKQPSSASKPNTLPNLHGIFKKK